MHRVLATFAFAACFITLPPAMAQRQAQISQGVTSGQLAATLAELQNSNADLGVQLTELQADNARLNGQVETLEFLLGQSREQVNEMQVDDAALDRLVGELQAKIDRQENQIEALERKLNQVALRFDEMNALESGPIGAPIDLSAAPDNAAPFELSTANTVSDQPTQLTSATLGDDMENGLPTGSLGTLSASDLPGEAGALFADAKSRLLRFDYDGAEVAFRAFLDQFGDDPQAGEAQYWLGEALYQKEAYAESGQAYTKMIREYPDDPRAPEALAKLARSMRLVGDTDRACSALDILPQRYPDASGVTRNLAAGERARSGCDS